MVPDFIIDRILMYTLMLDKGLEFGPIKGRFPVLRQSIIDYVEAIESGFVSNNSKEFKVFLEERVGQVEFVKPFALRIRPGSYRLFCGGKEVLK